MGIDVTRIAELRWFPVALGTFQSGPEVPFGYMWGMSPHTLKGSSSMAVQIRRWGTGLIVCTTVTTDTRQCSTGAPIGRRLCTVTEDIKANSLAKTTPHRWIGHHVLYAIDMSVDYYRFVGDVPMMAELARKIVTGEVIWVRVCRGIHAVTGATGGLGAIYLGPYGIERRFTAGEFPVAVYIFACGNPIPTRGRTLSLSELAPDNLSRQGRVDMARVVHGPWFPVTFDAFKPLLEIAGLNMGGVGTNAFVRGEGVTVEPIGWGTGLIVHTTVTKGAVFGTVGVTFITGTPALSPSVIRAVTLCTKRQPVPFNFLPVKIG